MTLNQFFKISEALTAPSENLKYVSLKGLNLQLMKNAFNGDEII